MRDWLIIAIGIGFLLSILPNTYAQENISSPLKQFKSGIPVQDIKCKEGFVLVVRESNGYPACVRPTSEQKLLTYGWITPDKITYFQNATTRYPIQSAPLYHTPRVATVDVSKLPPISPLPIPHAVSTTPLSSIDESTIINYSAPNLTKILAIGMSSNPFKVGDNPRFTVTYKNISDKPLYGLTGCGWNLSYDLSSNSVKKSLRGDLRTCGQRTDVIEPNQTITEEAGSYFQYNIIQPEKLTVTLTLVLRPLVSDFSNEITDTIQFNVNAIDGTTTRYPTESAPVHTAGPSSVINVRNLPPIPKCTYSNYFCSMLPNSVTPLPPIPVTPTISSNSNITKIISVGMFPNPLKVGDIPSFTVTYQNISGKPIYGVAGCGSDLEYTISPDANVKKIQMVGRQCAIFGDVIQPNQTITDGLNSSYYKIIQQGLLNVTLTLNLSDNGTNWSNSIDTIQFNVNATQ